MVIFSPPNPEVLEHLQVPISNHPSADTLVIPHGEYIVVPYHSPPRTRPHGSPKSSPLSPIICQQTLIGLNRNALFRINPRLSAIKLVDAASKQYASKTDFYCASTTGKGELAVGSSKGEIRLFNKLGDPIIGIDTIENGRWIIATCRNYILIDTEIPNEGGTSGFTKSMGREKPKRLQLKREHVVWMGMPGGGCGGIGEGCAGGQVVGGGSLIH
ncbi:hypothetical protein HDV00_006164 [Rhizophlyctis rosea]|nr:hypothetical protein HDV00_006164 [Rhizophlyctis rosea]